MTGIPNKQNKASIHDDLVITTLIPLKRLQAIQDAFAVSNGVASTITDIEGVPITRPSNHCAVCELIRNSPQGLKNCIISGKELGKCAREQQQPVLLKCLSIGFTDAVAPIIVNGKHIANWIVGQYDVRDVDEQRVRGYAAEIGIDPEKLAHAFSSMNKIPSKLFKDKLTFLEVLAKELSNTAFLLLTHKRQNKELQRTKTQLENFQKDLEKKVIKRTSALAESNRKLEAEILIKTKIQNEQNRLITAIECAAESFLISSLDGTIVYINPAFTTLTGYTKEEVLRQKTNILKSNYHDRKFYTMLWETITSGKIWSGIMTNKKKNGTLYQEKSTIAPVINHEGVISNYVAIKRDITQELEIEKELRRAQKLESIGTLAAGVAHEINSPLQFLVSNTLFIKDVIDDLFRLQKEHQKIMTKVQEHDLLSKEIISLNALADKIDLEFITTETESSIEQTLNGLDRITEIVKAMKDFATPDSSSKTMEDIKSLIKNVVIVSTSKWTEIAEITLELSDSLPHLLIYPAEFNQLILNMILNAVQAIEERYNAGDRQSGQIVIIANKNKSAVEIIIKDNGAGIEQHNIDKVFDPFFTTKAVNQGRGQSLATAYNFVSQQLKGTICVNSSRKEKCTSFTISIPLDGNS